MATYLPIQSISRSQSVRVGGQLIKNDKTYYVDISDGATRRDLQHHQAIGAVLVVGGLSASNSDVVVTSGANVDQGSSASDLNIHINAGELKSRSTGTFVAVPDNTSVVITTADATNPRIDVVVVDNSTGAATVTKGTAAATPTVPATPTGKTAVANVAVAATTTAIVNANITDVRPRS